MDTREKIKKPEDLPAPFAGENWTIAIGEFDPVNAAVADRLQELKAPGRRLLVIVKTGRQDALIPPQGRAVLLAALRSVDAVVNGSDFNWRELVSGNAALDVREDDLFDQQTRTGFEMLVISRQQAAGD